MTKAAETRTSILKTSFNLIYAHGYQATSIDEIIAHMQVTKGAFFYHFKNKEEMGLSMMKEILYPGMLNALIKPIGEAKDPVKAIYMMMENALKDSVHFDVRYGCPFVNLVDELSASVPSFKKQLSQMTQEWIDAIISCLESGKAEGKIKPGVDTSAVAYFTVSGYAGARNLGKSLGRKAYAPYLRQFKVYLENLN